MMVRNDILLDMPEVADTRSLIERVEDALLSVNPDLWLVSALLVVAIRCLGAL
ncbi:hypothetical protein [Nitrospirillum sp. BR 11163]|uniref:hypothetical protein n=1 Tax=Nitrospirillum sp. BR 11163 TaxID=3104323 RepID=UPI002AFF51C9|nr:hypothetical protein [Nitrospirillum sp. BR 11163]MEA1674482.1 hypothetical protein [Nitrospirillum sp. BR 11163]